MIGPGVRGVLGGALALVALEAVVSNKRGPAAVGGVWGFAVKASNALMSPDVPALKERSSSSGPGGTGPVNPLTGKLAVPGDPRASVNPATGRAVVPGDPRASVTPAGRPVIPGDPRSLTP